MEDKKLRVVDHVGELRKRIMISVVAFIAFFLLGFMYAVDLYKWFVNGFDVKLIVLGPSDILRIYFMLATVVAIAGSIPVVAIQLWLFVRPALSPVERKITLTYVPALFFLFPLGLAFGYFVIFPLVFTFLVQLGKDMFDLTFTAEKYFQFMMNITLPFGVLFELPVVVMFLTSLGIINPFALGKVRRNAYLVLVILAVASTPPNIMVDILVTIALIILYELSMYLSKFVYRKRRQVIEAEHFF